MATVALHWRRGNVPLFFPPTTAVTKNTSAIVHSPILLVQLIERGSCALSQTLLYSETMETEPVLPTTTTHYLSTLSDMVTYNPAKVNATTQTAEKGLVTIVFHQNSGHLDIMVVGMNQLQVTVLKVKETEPHPCHATLGLKV